MSKQQVSIFMGGTGANTVSDARANLGVLARAGDTMTGELNVANNLVVTGNVGIGTANALSKLDVHISGNQDAITISNDSDRNLIIGSASDGVHDDAVAVFNKDTNLGRFLFKNAGGDRMTLDNAGHLGLATTPSSWFVGVRAFEIGPRLALFDTGITGALSYNTYSDANGDFIYKESAHAALYDTSVGEHRWFTAASGTAGANITFTQAMTIDANGNVGIGTSAPATKLDIAGATYVRGDSTDATFTSPGQLAIKRSTNAPFFSFHANDGARIGYIQFDSGAASEINVVANQALLLRTNTVERVRITSTGDVGIGTSSPAAKLHVVGSGTTDQVIIENTDDSGATAPDLVLYRNSASPAASDNLGYVIFRGKDSAGNLEDYGAIYTTITSATSGSEGGLMVFETNKNGSNGAKMVIDSDGNVGIGTSPPSYPFHVVGSGDTVAAVTGGATSVAALNLGNSTNLADGGIRYDNSTDALIFRANNGEKARIDSSGNLGVGTSSPSADSRLEVASDASTAQFVDVLKLKTTSTGDFHPGILFENNRNSVANRARIAMDSASSAGTSDLRYSCDNIHRWFIGATERARITAGGYFKASYDGTYVNSTASWHEFTADNTDWAVRILNENNSTPYGLTIQYNSVAPNDTGKEFFYCYDSSVLRAAIRSNGGLANYQSNNADLSDIRTKKEITPAPSYWGKIGALEIVTYKYNDQTHDDVNVGVIAQQVESVEPVWVDSDGFGETPEGEEPLKTVYTKDITFAAIKALQEAMARIEQLEAKVASLEAK